MPDQWCPGTQYGYGSIVEYEGANYKIIQPHMSQGDWTPSATPALWGRIPGHVENHHEYEPPREPQQPPTQHSYGGDQQQGFPQQKPYDDHPDQTVNIPHEETKKKWYDLDDKRKHELEVGGGLLAGIAAIGAGYYAYHEHEKSEEEKKAFAWALQGWLRDAQQRTDEYRRNGPQAPTTWVLTEGHNFPQGALVGGQDDSGKPIYIARGFHENSIQVGKASHSLKHGAVIGYGHKEIDLPKYEILLGDPRAIQWVPTSGRLSVSGGTFNGARLVSGGNEPDGTPLYIAQAEYKGHVVVGKCSEKLNDAFVVWDGKEREVKHYKVLCYH